MPRQFLGKPTASRTLVLSAMVGGLGGCTTEAVVREHLEAKGFSAIELTRVSSTKYTYRATQGDEICEGEIEQRGLPGFRKTQTINTCRSSAPSAETAYLGNADTILLDSWYRVSEVEQLDDQAPPYEPGRNNLLFAGILFGKAWAETRVICLDDLSFDHAKREDVTYHHWVTGTGVTQYRWEDDGRLWLAPNMASADSVVLELERERHADRSSTWHSKRDSRECSFSMPDGHYSVDVQGRTADGALRQFTLTDKNGKTWYLLQSQGYLTEQGVEELLFKGLSKAE